MHESKDLNTVDLFGPSFPSLDERLHKAYTDPAVQERLSAIMRASPIERPELQAQLSAYLAAAHTLFPEESQIIHESLENRNEG